MKNKNLITHVTLLLWFLSFCGVSRAQVCDFVGPTQSNIYTSSVSSPTTIAVIFHVLEKVDGTGHINLSDIEDQIDVLNSAFSNNNSNFSFYLAGVEYIVDDDLHEAPLNPELAALTIDPVHVLNIDVYDMQPIDNFGFAIFPSSATAKTSNDFVKLDFVTLPNGPAPPVGIDFDAGDILVHEVGHYLGLKHVFSQACSVDEDGLTDTDNCTRNGLDIGTCPVGRMSCGDPDPVSNYMHTTGDTCRSLFSPQQKTRMDDETGTFRSGLGVSIIDLPNGLSSRPGELHPQPLTEPYVKVSRHTALLAQSKR